jgi:hypothetical protein
VVAAPGAPEALLCGSGGGGGGGGGERVSRVSSGVSHCAWMVFMSERVSVGSDPLARSATTGLTCGSCCQPPVFGLRARLLERSSQSRTPTLTAANLGHSSTTQSNRLNSELGVEVKFTAQSETACRHRRFCRVVWHLLGRCVVACGAATHVC